MSASRNIVTVLLLALAAVGCGSSQATETESPQIPDGRGEAREASSATRTKQLPPASGEARDVAFPAIARSTLENGLETNVVEFHQLPVIHLQLVVKSGGETDPEGMPGLSKIVAAMLKEGTKTKTSAALAEQIEFLGADLHVSSDEENVYVSMRLLREHLDQGLGILADVVMNPAFRTDELRKLKRRELDRLALQQNDPSFLAAQTFYRVLYAPHPYAHIDTTPEVVERVSRTDLSRWHRRFFVPNNTFLVVVGDTLPDTARAAAERAFARWRRGQTAEPEYASPPERTSREVIVVDRPDSVQSVISIGNLALPRSSPDYVPFLVANQVLGGSAASRLFMDLRERRSLTYGAYSRVGEMVQIAPFRARGSVRTQVTDEATRGFLEHLQRIVREAPPPEELADAKRFLVDSFPLQIDSPGKIASLVAELRVFGLPDNYWDSFRSQIGQVSADMALAAARKYVRPEQSLMVIVGKAADIAEPLRRYGPVTVISPKGEVLQRLEAVR